MPARNDMTTTTERAMPVTSSRTRLDRSAHQGFVWLLMQAYLSALDRGKGRDHITFCPS
jgi:hypothetical protein